MRIIGIDPGTAIVGFSILEVEGGKLNLLNYGCIRTAKGLPASHRLQEIAEDLNAIIKKWQPKRAAVEKLFFQKNVKTAMSVSQARGVILQKLTENGISTNEYTPLEIKSAVCGYGKADKKMVQQMVKIILNLSNTPKPDDAADAVAAAICLANCLPLEAKINEQ